MSTGRGIRQLKEEDKVKTPFRSFFLFVLNKLCSHSPRKFILTLGEKNPTALKGGTLATVEIRKVFVLKSVKSQPSPTGYSDESAHRGTAARTHLISATSLPNPMVCTIRVIT